MRRRFSEYTNSRKVFKQTYIGSCIGGLFALPVGFAVRYDDGDLNIAKWKGLIIGCLIHVAVIIATYYLSRVLLPLGITVFVSHIVQIVLVGILYKTGC